MSRFRRSVLGGGVFLAFFVGTFIVIEGAASALLLGYDAVAHHNPGLASRAYSTYDSTLGWINLPGFRDDDMYGPRAGLRINGQSFRHDGEVPSSVPVGRVRILCSGDSFTFGIGVDGAATWCRGLEQLPNVETVNLGHAGYGLDQASLFHERVSRQLGYDVHVLAFVADDFRRMRLRRFIAYDKPVLRLEGERLVVDNVPVPKMNALERYVILNNRLSRLRSLEFAHRLLNLTAPADRSVMSNEELRATAVAVMRSVAERDRSRGSETLFVLLPQEIREPLSSEEWGDLLPVRLGEMGLPFVDLSREFRKLPLATRGAMLDPRWSHYSVGGNDWVAAQLREQLRRLPPIAVSRNGTSQDQADSK